MPTDRPVPFWRAAVAITDGKDIDWNLLSANHPELAPRLRALMRIQALAAESRARLAELAPAATVAPSGSASSDLPVPPTEPFDWGPLRVLKKIGQGSFGEVFLARDPSLEREVALKLMFASGHALVGPSFLDEARRLARVRHPNVLTVHGVEVHDGRAGIWTDHLSGETLEHQIRSADLPGAEEIGEVAAGLCRALAAVHRAGIIHGDIKAANVMRERGGRVILMDFGAGSARESEMAGETRSGSETRRAPTVDTPMVGTRPVGTPVVGTPLVMAPELLRGEPPGVSSDLYALGVLLYRLASGCYPFRARNLDELAERHRSGPRIPLAEIRPDLPEGLVGAIERALEADPSARFAGAEDMGLALAGSQEELVSAASAQPVSPAASNLPQALERWVGRARELQEVRSVLLDRRLVVLVGSSGLGKTRMALEVAKSLKNVFPEETIWIPARSLLDPSWFLPAISPASSPVEAPDPAPEALLLDSLRGRTCLLALDDWTSAGEACVQTIGRVLDECPGVRIIVTGPKPLGLPGEMARRVSPLSVPHPSTSGHDRFGLEIADFEGVRLFLARAQRARPGFVLSRAGAPALGQICRRLHGIPLAIELAASRMRMMGLEEMDAGLCHGLAASEEPAEEGALHDELLNDTMEWSYRLSTPAEQALLRRMAVDPGAWSLEAAERICRDPHASDPTIAGEPILDLLSALVESHLVAVGSAGREVRTAPDLSGPARPGFFLHESIRRFAAGRALAERP